MKDFDYGAYGYYYVTICTRNKKCLLSTISVGSDALVAPNVTPTKLGEKVWECFNNIAIMNENIEIDTFILMPNHIHAIIIIKNEEPVEQIDKKYAFEISERRGRRSLQGLMKDFKSITTRYYKNMFNANCSLRQESFYDEVIKNDEHYLGVCQYINDNPNKWAEDKYFYA